MIEEIIELKLIQNEMVQEILIEYKSDRGITFTEFFYRFIQSDADACKLNEWGRGSEYFIITKSFIQNKLIRIRIIQSNTDEQ
jgi:hypothetical protein